jgi:hypothetical protein
LIEKPAGRPALFAEKPAQLETEPISLRKHQHFSCNFSSVIPWDMKVFR